MIDHGKSILLVAARRLRSAVRAGALGMVLGCGEVAAQGAIAPAADHGVVLLAYHQIGADAFPDASLQRDVFAEQARLLAAWRRDGTIAVATLPEIAARLANGQPPDRQTVGISFEAAHRSALLQAMPILIELELPFTVFVSTDLTDARPDAYASWAELRALRARAGGLVSFGVRGAAVERWAGMDAARRRNQLARARERFEAELGQQPLLFSYPYGVFDQASAQLLADAGFIAALSLESGVAAPQSDRFALPRFSVTDGYGDLDRFRTVVQALPLPVTDMVPSGSLIEADDPVGFTVRLPREAVAQIACFASGRGRLAIDRLGDQRLELRPAGPAAGGFWRLNCTLPVATDDGPVRWRWFGRVFVDPTAPPLPPG